MSHPLKIPRQAANDLCPPRSPTAPTPAVKTITLTYRPVKKPSRLGNLFVMLLLCGLTGASAWYASKAFALFVATKAMVVDLNIPLPPQRPLIMHAPTPPVQAIVAAPEPAPAQTVPAPQVVLLPVPDTTAQTPIVQPHDEITLPAEKLSPVPATYKTAEVSPAPAPAPTDVEQVTVTPPEMSEEQLLDDAHTLFESGDSNGALGAYDQILAADQVSQAALAGKAFVLARTQQFEASIAISHQLLKLYPHDDAARLNLVITLGRWPSPKAVDELQKIIASNPENATAHMALGKQYERQGDFQRAIVELDTAAHQAPADISYRLDLAILYDHAGYASQAIALYQQVLQASTQDHAATSVPISTDALGQRIGYLESLGGAQPNTK